MVIIQKGTVAIRKMKGGGQVEIAKIYANEVVGELSFFDRAPRSASAIAMSEVDAIEINFESLDKIYSQVPGYFKTFIACLAERLRKAGDTIRRLEKHLAEEVSDSESDRDSDVPDVTSVLAAISGTETESDGRVSLIDQALSETESDLESQFDALSQEEEKKSNQE